MYIYIYGFWRLLTLDLNGRGSDLPNCEAGNLSWSRDSFSVQSWAWLRPSQKHD